MHMPGHKRNISLTPFLKELRADLDITEIDGFDNLAHPEGIIKETMDKMKNLWNTKESYLLSGGSSCGILAGIRTLTHEGDTILLCRGSHKSVYHAVEISGLKTQFLQGEIYNSTGSYPQVSPLDVDNSLKNNKDIKMVLITSPSYEGIISNIEEIAKICHKYNVPLMVDEAHGSHLVFSPYFSKGAQGGVLGAVENGADLVVESLHKTLLGLTQTAVCHVNGDLVDTKLLEHNLRIFQTSSPSYILMASICGCIEFVEKNPQAFTDWENYLEEFYLATEILQNITISKEKNRDKSKILIDCSKANISGQELMMILRDEYNIELEMAYGNFALAMTGLGETRENLIYLKNALIQIDLGLKKEEKEIFSLKSFYTNPKITIKDAFFSENIKSAKENAINKVSGDYLWVYPPGIPILLPGEIITKEVLKTMDKLENLGSEIIDTKGAYPEYLSVLP